MSRLSNIRAVDPVLSNLAVGYHNAEYIADGIFPLAPVPKEGGRIPKHTKQSFKSAATERALRANSNRLEPEDRGFIDFTLEEHDLSVPMDYREGQDQNDFDVEAANSFLAVEGISLRREKIAADLAFNPANFAASNKLAVTSTDKWSATGTSNPIAQITTGREQVRKSIAKRPNVIAMGASAFNLAANHPKVLERLTYTQLGVITPQLLAAILQVDEVIVGDAISVSDDGNTTSDIWNDSCLLFYRRPVAPNGKRSVFEPNFGYTVYKTMAEIDKYIAEGGKIQNIRATAIFKQLLVGADAGYLITGLN